MLIDRRKFNKVHKIIDRLTEGIEDELNYLDIGTNVARVIDRYDYKFNNGWVSI